MSRENETVDNYFELTSMKMNEVGIKFWQLWMHYPMRVNKQKKINDVIL